MAKIHDDEATRRARALRGLCLTCDRARDCMHITAGDSQVLRCEDFAVVGTVRRSVRAAEPPVERDAALDRRLGLCRTCDRADTCTLPRAEGGVWHCEEFA